MDFFHDADIRHYAKLLFIGICVFLIGGMALYFIFRPSHQIVLKKDVVEYGSNIYGPAKLVEKIGKVEVSSSEIKSSTLIELEGYEISFTSIDPYKLGEQEIIASFSNEIDPQTFVIKVVDSESPKIVLNEMPEEVDLSFVDSEGYKEKIAVSDNYTPAEDIELEYTFSEKPDHGLETELQIRATDSNGNSSKATHKFRIKEKPSENKEESKPVENDAPIEKEEESQTQPSVVAPSVAPPAVIIPDLQVPEIQAPDPAPLQPTNPKPSNRTYMFSDGYTMQTAPSACQADLAASGYSGACIPIQDGNGIYKGMQLVFD